MQRESLLNASDSCPSFLNPVYRITVTQIWCPKNNLLEEKTFPINPINIKNIKSISN